MESTEYGSVVAHILAQIREEYESAQMGLSGLAIGTARHEVIAQKMTNLGNLQKQLEIYVDPMEAIALIIEQIDGHPSSTSKSIE
jgi:hypothetical protein